MKLVIAGKPQTETALEFDLVHDDGDVVLISNWAGANKSLEDSEVLRFKPNGRCIAAIRDGIFHKRDKYGCFLIENAGEAL